MSAQYGSFQQANGQLYVGYAYVTASGGLVGTSGQPLFRIR